MKFPFDTTKRLLIVRVQLTGRRTTLAFDAVLDTGASRTIISELLLSRAGYSPKSSRQLVTMNTASGTTRGRWVTVKNISALGVDRNLFPVVASRFPSTSNVRCLLGLDFFVGCNLEIDFRSQIITVT